MPLFLDAHACSIGPRTYTESHSSEADSSVFVIRKIKVDGNKCYCILDAPAVSLAEVVVEEVLVVAAEVVVDEVYV